MLKYAAAAALMLAAAPAFAQSGATQSPPSPNASTSAPTPATSVPEGALTTNPGASTNPNVSGAIGGGPTVPAGSLSNAPSPGTPMGNTVPQPATK